jgi:hypothetical protein
MMMDNYDPKAAVEKCANELNIDSTGERTY